MKFNAVRRWEKAYVMNLFDANQAVLMYEELLPNLRYNGSFLFNYGAILSEAGRYQRSIKILKEARNKFNHIDLFIYLGNNYKELGQYEKSEQCYLHASHMIPSKFYPKYLLVLLYRENNSLEKAKEMALTIVNMKVKVPSETVDFIKEEMNEFLTSE